MKNTIIIELLTKHGIKPTANRILIADALYRAGYPMSMKELENKLITIDKSSIFRALTAFRENRLVHNVEDGNDVVRYELCLSHDDNIDDDLHVHFYCEQCHRTFCLPDTPVPEVTLPAGYKQRNVNYMIKGICPKYASSV